MSAFLLHQMLHAEFGAAVCAIPFKYFLIEKNQNRRQSFASNSWHYDLCIGTLLICTEQVAMFLQLAASLQESCLLSFSNKQEVLSAVRVMDYFLCSQLTHEELCDNYLLSQSIFLGYRTKVKPQETDGLIFAKLLFPLRSVGFVGAQHC